MKLLLSSFLSLVFAVSAAAQGQVWLVDGNASPAVTPDFTTLQEGLDAAAAGDTILVVPIVAQFGDYYLHSTLDGKALTLLSTDPDVRPSVNVLEVSNVPAGGSITVRGLEFGSLSFEACAAEIVLEDDFVWNLEADQCSTFVATRVETRQSARMLASTIACFACSFLGRNGSNASAYCAGSGDPFGGGTDLYVTWSPSTPGTAGLVVLGGSAATLVGCSATGGAGGGGHPGGTIQCGFGVSGTAPCLVPSIGGHGLVASSGAVVRNFGCTFTAGATGFAFGCGGGVSAEDVNGGGSTEELARWPGSGVPATLADVRSTEGSSPMQNGGTTDFTFRGQPGDVVFLQYGTHVAPQYVPALSGVWVTTPTGYLLSPGVVPADGELAVTFGVTAPLTTEFEQFHGQGFFVRAIGGEVVVWAGSPTSVTLLQ